MTNLENAIGILGRQGHTCVLCKDHQIHFSDRRGVAPLLELLEGGICVRGFSAADKVVGKATALLYCLLQVEAVHGQVMSDGAVRVLEQHGIRASWDRRVPAIENRSRDGFCPMETATARIEDPAEALDAIRQTLSRLQAQEQLPC